jgi:hypothetical protein
VWFTLMGRIGVMRTPNGPVIMWDNVLFTGEISPEGEFFLPLAYFWRNLDPKKTFL